MSKWPGAVVGVALLFGPAVVALFSRPAAYVLAGCSVVVLVWLLLRGDSRES